MEKRRVGGKTPSKSDGVSGNVGERVRQALLMGRRHITINHIAGNIGHAGEASEGSFPPSNNVGSAT